MIRKSRAQRMTELAEKEATRIHRHNRLEPLERLNCRLTAAAKRYVEELATAEQQTVGKTLTQIIEEFKATKSG